MYLLPGNLFSHAVEAYRDSGEGRCANHAAIARPLYGQWRLQESNSHWLWQYDLAQYAVRWDLGQTRYHFIR